VVPISALTFRNEGQAKTWNKRLRASVIAEARTAGLSRRRFGPAIVTLLVVVAAIAGVVVGLAALHYGIGKADDDKPGFGAGLVVFFLLSALGGRALGERDTPAGRAAAGPGTPAVAARTGRRPDRMTQFSMVMASAAFRRGTGGSAVLDTA
jgi:hypothetical protein